MSKQNRIIIFGIIALVTIILAVFYFIPQKPDQAKESEPSIEASYPIGKVKPCAINPIFPLKNGLKPPLLIDLRQQGYLGIRIIENRPDGKILQFPEWSNYGWLGLYTLDNQGNIYLTSVPHESIIHNPVGTQNRILKVDSQTGAISEFMKLPQKEESTLKNPFGAIGLHFDCDNRYLYVTSLAGSTMREDLGNIFQIDLEKKEIISRLENVDAIGLSTFNTNSGKRLYFGLAREAEIHSIALDNEGKLSGESRFEFSLLDQPGGAFDKAHRIRFIKDFMEIKANNFTYTLAAASDPERNIYRFRYDQASDKWLFMDVHLQKQ